MKIRTNGKHFVDEYGRTVIFNGINLVCKNKAENYLGDYNEDTVLFFSKCGFNLIRLGIIWDGVEPSPLEYDDEYINKIREFMDICQKHEIYIFLDMHQDLYAQIYSDGAPLWACLNEGAEHITGEVWSDSYLISSAVQNAFSNFWNNEKSEAGLGLQDHYAKMWRHILKALGDHPMLIGCDFLNEPFVGKSAPQVYGNLFEGFAKKLYDITSDDYYLNNLSNIFKDKDKMFEALSVLSNEDIYKSVVDNLGSAIKEFDEDVLSAFYRKMTIAVREISYDGLIMMENNYFSNMGIPCGLKKTIDDNSCFAPHGYDLVVDTEGVGALSSNGRVKTIFDGHLNTQERLNVPVVVGEWGAFAHYEDTIPQCRYLISLFEKNLWSSTYWCYHNNLDNAPVLKYLKRAYPIAMVGKTISYHYDFENRNFTCKWDEGENKSGKSELYLPFMTKSEEHDVLRKEDGCIVRIKATGGIREISLTPTI